MHLRNVLAGCLSVATNYLCCVREQRVTIASCIRMTHTCCNPLWESIWISNACVIETGTLGWCYSHPSTSVWVLQACTRGQDGKVSGRLIYRAHFQRCTEAKSWPARPPSGHLHSAVHNADVVDNCATDYRMACLVHRPTRKHLQEVVFFLEKKKLGHYWKKNKKGGSF
jgi:hypothetical protein